MQLITLKKPSNKKEILMILSLKSLFFVVLFEVIIMEEFYEQIKQNRMLLSILGVVLLLLGVYYLTHQQRTPIKNEIKTEQVKPPVKKTREKAKLTSSKLLVVDIQGAVKKPGVYRLKDGAIIQTAIQMAGGLDTNADVKQLNQAKKIADQMQIYVPLKGETSGSAPSSDKNQNDGKVVNINTASVDDFKNVTGIGPKKAAKIIAFREKNGNFKDLHDLTKVSGIGEKSLDSLKDQLTV